MAGEFKLREAVPWGRNRVEYLAFFDLLSLAAGATILDCAAGPSSFNAQMTRLGYEVVSIDPLYRLTRAQISLRIERTREVVMAGLREAADRFVWTDFGSPDALEATRLATMKHFLEDYEEGLAEGRYRDLSLPELPFAEGAFDLVLSSHFLFTYSAQLDAAFHGAALLEMARVGREVRVFPLLDLDGAPSPHLAPSRDALARHGYRSEERKVPYEFQKGGDRMLRITTGADPAKAG